MSFLQLDAETFRELLAILASRVGFDPAQSDKGGWGRAYWLYQPNELLARQAHADYADALTDPVRVAMLVRNMSAEARTPVETLIDDPQGVLGLARGFGQQTPSLEPSLSSDSALAPKSPVSRRLSGRLGVG